MKVEILPGAMVECSDGPLGIVERVLTDECTGECRCLLVRHGRADYLLCVPERYVAATSPWRVRLDARFDEVEMAAIAAGRVPLDCHNITDGGPARPSPFEEDVLGRIPGSPHGSPFTG